MLSGSVEWPPRKTLRFPDPVRERLRRPLGKLLVGEPREVAEKLSWIIELENPLMVISVGDFVSRNLVAAGLRVDICVVDGRVKRKPIRDPEIPAEAIEEVVNSPGTINLEAAERLHTLIWSGRPGRKKLVVRGEEDLLALAAILSAPKGSLVIYGQPDKGAVVVKVDEESKNLASRIVLRVLEMQP